MRSSVHDVGEVRAWLAVLALMSFVAPAFALQDGMTLRSDASLSSRYVRRGVERTGAAVQASMDGSIGGLRGGIWINQPIATEEEVELQTRIGYEWTVGDTLTLEATGTHFWYSDAPTRADASHSFEAAANLVWKPRDALGFGFSVFYDIRFESAGSEIRAASSLPISALDTALEYRAYAGFLAGRDVLADLPDGEIHDSYGYWGAGLRLPFRISEGMTIAAEANIATSQGQNILWSPLRVGSGTRGWISVGASYAF